MKNITLSQIETWEFQCITPAGGRSYFNKELDCVATRYRTYARLFFNRKMEGKSPYCFKESINLFK